MLVASSHERIVACLKGLAGGDAIGKQTEMMTRERLLRWYPAGVRGFESEPGTVIPRYVGNSKREWLTGETTDDTERTIAVARAILEDGDVRHGTVGRHLLRCTKCIHPGVESLWEFHQAGDAERVTRDHDGCGAAIRVAPVGILYRSHRFDEIVTGAREASIPTHGGPLALAAAAATAVAVSAAIDGAQAPEILDLALRAATAAERERSGCADASFAEAVRTIHRELDSWTHLEPSSVAERYFPADPLTIVPLALALALVRRSAEGTILVAANIGGDSDSVASIAGAILGARFPDTVNETWHSVVETVNHHDIVAVAEALNALRH